VTDPQQTKKRSGRGPLMVVVVLLGLVLLGAGLGWKGKALLEQSFGAGISAVQAIAAAQSAPGAAEARRRGCNDALVLTASTIESVGEMLALVDPEEGMPAPGSLPDPLVVCRVASRESAPTCQSVAIAYATAFTTPPPPFGVQVETPDEVLCAGLHQADGTRLAAP
jgi:hypothetical protein